MATDLAGRLTAAVAADVGQSSDFDLNPGFRLSADRHLRAAAVLVPIMPRPDGATVVLTKRSSRLRHHPGQVAFPGGKVDDTDADATAAALREAEEEVGLTPASVRVLGPLGPHETVTAFRITPILGLVEGPFVPRPEQGEVAEVFEVSLSHVTNPANFQIQYRMWQGQRRHYYTVPYGPYYIWGASARILRGLADRMA